MHSPRRSTLIHFPMLNVKCHGILIVILKLTFKFADIFTGRAMEDEQRKKELLNAWLIPIWERYNSTITSLPWTRIGASTADQNGKLREVLFAHPLLEIKR